ncbi:MAG: class I SAM-dependent rRNA methyltransferase, partial [Bacteroidales bacterium]|nr:class I SAM-dependent rRNA methyltransferase [Bacteroidales bacterium]
MDKVILKPRREESILRFHPWVFSGAIAQITGHPAEGDMVGVYSADGKFLCSGHYQIGSIAVRILSFDEDPSRPDFWTLMLSRALRLREAYGLAGSASTTCYRLVHGEGDGLPGLIVDYYDGVCVLQAHSVGMFRSKGAICAALQEVYGDSLKAVYDKSS